MDKENVGIEYEKRKCCACKLVYTNSFVFSTRGNGNFVICKSCTMEIYRSISMIKKDIDDIVNENKR